jgi:hypothetical protein
LKGSCLKSLKTIRSLSGMEVASVVAQVPISILKPMVRSPKTLIEDHAQTIIENFRVTPKTLVKNFKRTAALI